MKLKKAITSGIIIAMTMSLVACGGGNSKSDTNTQKSSEIDKISYEYEQDLNIIDDNYRNYYEIFVYSFADSNGDGVGDLKGIENKLDYIADMGFNGIWMTPIMPSTTYHKYDVTDYCNIDKEYGTLDDFKSLLNKCHEKGINLIIDVPFNHSSSKHPWFVEATDYLKGLEKGEEPDANECKYVDYYHFSKEQEDATYYNVPGTEYYYEGSFWQEMPDLNLENESLKQDIKDIAKFWVDLGVDGFRMDAVMHYSETDEKLNTSTINWIYEYCKELNKDFYMVSEVWANEETIASYYTSKTPSMFNFDTSSVEGCLAKVALGNSNAESYVNKMVEYQEKYSGNNPDFIDAPFLTNHDQVRIANNLQCDANKIKEAAGLLLMMSGNPFVYYGEEIGMISKGSEDENKRLPMYWSKDGSEVCQGAENAAKDVEQVFDCVDDQLKDSKSILNYYKRAIRLRNENPEIARGKVEIVDSLTEGDVAVITKEYDGSKIAILFNTSDEAKDIDISSTDIKDMDIRGYLTLNGEVVTMDNGKVSIPSKGICILK